YDSSGQSEYAFTKPYSEKTAEKIDEEVKKLVNQAFDTAMEVLEKNREGLDKLAQQLLDKEVIYTEDLETIFGKRPQLKNSYHVEQTQPIDPNSEKSQQISNQE
ncbi:MAG TPA: cell division protein FtsH, partial [Salinivirgaceae bacterium]|nr:cell division protein FtsH [Salinivirgaceae bacterium]